jgi:thiol:disulfide interchange protein DsbD
MEILPSPHTTPQNSSFQRYESADTIGATMTQAALIQSALFAALLLAPPMALAAQQTVVLEYQDHIPLSPTESKAVQIDVNVIQGFHVQANPASRENLIPTELILEPSSQLQFSIPTYPKGTPFRMSPIGTEVLTYSGSFQIGVAISRLSKSPLKSTLVKGKIRYQACDEKTCLRPSAVPFEFWVENP